MVPVTIHKLGLRVEHNCVDCPDTDVVVVVNPLEYCPPII